MLNFRRILSIIFTLVVFFNSISLSVCAQEEKPTLKAAMSEDESIIVERILYTALKRMGYQMTTKTAGMRTMVNDVNYGDSAIVPAQALGLDEEYTNLIRVPVPISYVEINVYARSEDNYQFTSWDELTGLRLSHCWKNLFVTNNVPRANASEVVVHNEYEDLWESLLTNETDVALIPNLTGFVRVVPEGVAPSGVVERQPRFTYLNKDYEYLLPLFTETYQEMTDDGTMEQIRSSTQLSDKKTILHISSYNKQVEWEYGEEEALRKSFELSADLEYYNLYLNARSTDNKADTQAVIANTIRASFIESNPDLIIVSDNDALEFAMENYYMLFPKVPVVFCGINDFEPSMLHGFEDYVTGVTETVTARETVEEMLRLYPQTKRIFILNDYTNSGLIWRNCIEKDLDGDALSLQIEFNENKLFSEILEDIKGFESDTLVLIGTYFLDGSNMFYPESKVQELVCSVSEMPVFCLASSFNGYGTLGGLVSYDKAQGEAAGVMANAVLSGTSPSDIPIIVDSKPLNRWQFDYAVAKSFGINTDTLPAGHTAINREIPIWESNPTEFKLAMVGCVVFLAIIFCLAVFLRLMKNKNADLMELQSHLHSAEELLAKDNDLRRVIEFLPVAVLIVDIETCKPEYGNQVFLSSNALESFEQAQKLDLSILVNTALLLWKGQPVSFQFGSLQNPHSDVCQKITVEKLIYRDNECFLLICEDITAQIREKEMLASAAEKEREASRAKSNFLSNMSHEIRTPLTAITGMTLIGKSSADLDKKDYAFDKIEDASTHLLSVINDILDMSKIEANKFELSFVEFNFENLLQKVANVFSFRIDEKHLSFSVFLDRNIPVTLIGDDHRLVQVITNLISNAIKFTPEEGYIRLKTCLLEENGDDCTLQIEVADTGIGINPDRLSGIFNSFEQAENDTTRQYGGTGLGLSISRHITELMGGRIWVESTPGKGSKFAFTAKLKRGTENEDSPAKPVNNRENLRVLVIDDESDIRQYFKSIADSIGIICDTASNGNEALELIQNDGNYDIYFVDWNMPEMNGIELACKIRECAADNSVIIMISSFEWSVIEEDAKVAGVNKFLPKPLFPSAVVDCINECLGYHKVLEHSDMPIELASYPGRRVLLAEDVEINREIITTLFSPSGIEFDCAENGEEAIQLFTDAAGKYDLILMDLQMPKMGGLDATTHIRDLDFPSAKTVPIIAMTANVFREDIEQCLNAGMNDHVSKPLDFKEVFGTMKKWLK